MKTSARNQFQGRVASVTGGAVNDEVVIDIADGLQVVAIVTHESVQQLGLVPGKAAIALIKASSIILAVGTDTVRFSARNQLQGTICRVVPGAVNCEVTVSLADGVVLAAIVTQESAQTLGLAPGAPVTALFKASSVMVGVPV